MYRNEDAGLDEVGDPDEAGLVGIDPQRSSAGYRDMQDFIELVPDRHAQDLLSRAIEGRGAFRRFKDTLFEFDELRTDWFAFRDARARRHALNWLLDEGVISEDGFREVSAEHRDPPVGGPDRVASVGRRGRPTGSLRGPPRRRVGLREQGTR